MAQRILLGYVAVILIHESPEDMPALGNVQILPKSNMGTEWSDVPTSHSIVTPAGVRGHAIPIKVTVSEQVISLSWLICRHCLWLCLCTQINNTLPTSDWLQYAVVAGNFSNYPLLYEGPCSCPCCDTRISCTRRVGSCQKSRRVHS